MKNQQKTLGIYIRVSTKIQADKGLSADDQQDRGIELANQLGWRYKLYDDRGISASKISYTDRNLAELLLDCKYKLLSGIYCVDIDRWSRDKNFIEGQVIITAIKESGVQVFTPTGEYKLNDPNTEFMVRLKSMFASMEVNNRRASIIRNLERSAQLGRAKGGKFIPYGYKKDENKMLVIDKEEAKIVKWIYCQSFEGKGKGCLVIARLLNENGIPTRQQKMVDAGIYDGMMVRGEKQTNFKWRDKTVLDMLQNSIYKGERRHRNIIVKSPVIIEPALWDAVQIQIHSRNQYKDTNNVYDYLLKGLIHCPICGRKIQGKKRANGKDNCYTCMSYREGPNCGNRGINIDYLEELVTNNILDLENIIQTAFGKSDMVKRTKEYTDQSNKISQEISEIETSIDNLLDLSMKSKNNAKISERIDKLTYTLTKLKEKKENTDRELTIVAEKDNLLEVARSQVKEFKKAKTFENKVAYVQNIIRKIQVAWVEESNVYDILISFKLSQFENYLIAKELTIDRNGRKNGKAVTKVLNDDVTIQRLIIVDEDNNIQYSEASVNYTKYRDAHFPQPVERKKYRAA
jgi:site-specific DNA recombinase